MQAAPGHGEYVVNSKGRVDNYYVSPEGILYSEVRQKDFRLQPKIDPITNKVSLERADNPFELKYEPALDEKTILYLNDLSKFIEKKYGKRMDMEFVYDPETNKINIVQARAIPEGQRKGLAPSAVSPDFLGKNKSRLNIVEGLQVITPDVNTAAVVTNANQVIICNSIEEALSRYNAKGKDAGIIGVIVQQSAPDTSHEAGVFNGAGIRVMQVKDITAFEKLLENKQPIIIDPQHSKVYQLPKDLFNAEGKNSAEIEQALYKDEILAKGIYASALTSYVTAVKHIFTAEGVSTTVPVSTEGVLVDKTLGKLLAEAKAGSKEATEQLLSMAYETMSFEGLDSRLRGNDIEGRGNGDIVDKAEKLRANLDTLSAPKIGQSNDELKAALGSNLKLLGNSYKKNLISEDLFKQAIIAGTEVGILLDKMSKLEGLSKEQQDKTYLEYFNTEKKLKGLLIGEGDSLANSLKAKQYELMAEQLNPEIKGDARTYLVESLKLRDYLISDTEKKNWDKFCAKACVNPENAKVLGSIVNKAVSFNAHEQWINYIFADVNDPANPGATLAKLVKDFNSVDLNKIQNATKLIKSMESQIPEWSDPSKFPKLYKELQENIKTINENLKWNKDATNLEKVLILEQVNRLTDIMDKSTKSLERSSQYLDSMKDQKGNDLQTARFKDMVTEFHGVMKVWVGNNPSLTPQAQWRIDAMEEFLNSKTAIQLNKNELSPSSNFAVNTATFTAPGAKPSSPTTLEDIFTLIHQNTIIATTMLSNDLSKILEKQYPNLLNILNQEFDNKILGQGEKHITPSTAIEFDNKKLEVIKNIPLREHSCIADIKYDTHNKATSVSFSIYGINGNNRWDNVIIDSYLLLKNADCKFITNPYFDKTKEIVNFEVKIENEQQAKILIESINKSIKTSFDLVSSIEKLEAAFSKRIQILDELTTKGIDVNNIKFIPNSDITYLEFNELQKFNKLQKNTLSISQMEDLKVAGLPLEKLETLIVQAPELSKLLLEKSANIKILTEAGCSLEEFKEIYQSNPELSKNWLENANNIKILNEVGCSWQEFKEIHNQEPKLNEFLLENALKVKTQENCSFKEFKIICKNNPELSKLLLENPKSINALTEAGCSFEEFKKVYDKNPELGKFWLENAKNVKSLNKKFEFSWDDIKELRPEMRKFWLKDPVLINMYNNNGLRIPDLIGIYKKDEKLFDAIIANSGTILSTLRDKELTTEDLKKCKAEGIQNLAKGTISVEQLKTTLTTSTTLAAPKSPPIRKWTEKIQNESQTNTKSNQRY
ncbi:MAG: Pyruvate phosphate dikinase, AMP/ATP-binding domain [Pseudomonadota bacterium]|jgi:hypothetical protein